MNDLKQKLQSLSSDSSTAKSTIVREVVTSLQDAGYETVEINEEKPWGAYVRISSEYADRFVETFFPGLSPLEARLGNVDAELSPKILLVSPSHRLSWQYHNRRAERWVFLSAGSYERSLTDVESDATSAVAGEVVQFAQGERHRLVGATDTYVVVAEIWQHTNPSHLSNEEDIIRLADDYVR